jgi:hypothetical protein
MEAGEGLSVQTFRHSNLSMILRNMTIKTKELCHERQKDVPIRRFHVSGKRKD